MADLQEDKNTIDNLIIAALIAIAILALLLLVYQIAYSEKKIIEKGTNIITKVVQNSLNKKQ